MWKRYLVKLVLNGAVLMPLLFSVTNATIWQIIVSSVALSVLAFLVGDQWILRSAGNPLAIIADAAIAGLYFWVLNYYFDWRLSGLGLTSIVVIIGVVEAMYHRLLQKWDEENRAFSIRDI